MKIVKLKGGIGNQLFQYTFAKNLELLTGEKILLDTSAYLEKEFATSRQLQLFNFNISLETADKYDLKQVCKFNFSKRRDFYKIEVVLEKLFNRKYYFEKDRKYISPEKIMKFQYFNGYWQAWKNVWNIEQILRQELTYKGQMSEQVLDICQEIEKNNAVFMGIRRGDYLKKKKHYGEFTKEYYQSAMNWIKKRERNVVYYVFSNDIHWVKENMKFSDSQVKYMDKGLDDLEELVIMSRCRHAIICNSTYYWWAAWLIENKDKIVIAPKKWFADDSEIDIIPDGWVRM